MADDSAVCSCIVDCAGLHEIASVKSNNLKQLFFDRLSSGVIAVPAIVLKEFRELYEEEAEVLEPYIAKKIVMKREYHAGAARIADSLNSGFSRGPYDGETDLYTASIASLEGYVVLTSASQAGYYDGMDCEVSDVMSWVEQQG